MSKPSAERIFLEQYLKDMAVGDVVTFRQLSDITQRDFTNTKNRGIFHLAQKKLEKEDGIVFQNIPLVGYRRLNNKDQTLSFVEDKRLKRVTNAAQRARTVLHSVDIGSLDKESQSRALAISAQLTVGMDSINTKTIERQTKAYNGLQISDLNLLALSGFTG